MAAGTSSHERFFTALLSVPDVTGIGAIATASLGPDLLVETAVDDGGAAALGGLGRQYRPSQKPMPAQSSIRKHVLRKFLFIELQLLRQDTPLPEIAK
ncbi:MAG TPA: hypothetical protein VN048_02920 [Verrucomicrobiae bacterium]|nr:hypothetical protein [Verrucomicrobiae bacterium]